MKRVRYHRFRVTDFRVVREGDYLNSWQVGGRTIHEVSRPIVAPEEPAPSHPPSSSTLDALIVFAYIMGGVATIMLTAAICVGVLQ